MHELAWFDEVLLAKGQEGHGPDGGATGSVRRFIQQDVSGWYVTGHRRIRLLLTDPRLTSARTAASADLRARCPEMFGGGGTSGRRASLIELDGPAHTRLRTTLGRAITPRVLLRLRARSQDEADRLLSGFAKRGSVELVSEYVRPLAVATTMELLGVPLKDHERLTTHVLDGALTGPEREAHLAELQGYFAALVAVKRAGEGDGVGHGDTDLLRNLAASRTGDDPLTDDEICDVAQLLLIAGTYTLPALTAGAVWQLLADEELGARLAAAPTTAPCPDVATVVDELLRRTSVGEDAVVRFAAEDLEIDGVAVAAGDLVLLDLAAADHDPAVFDEPARLCPRRAPNPHLAFGQGLHYCLGAGLVRTQLTVALGALLDRCGSLRPVAGDGAVTWRHQGNGAWPTRLEVTFVER
ncbi:cytochrome P450 [Streptomyces sp. NPDC058579]|uniref:cytochrome P450 n=1 Tax=Streptomyces sp. NPDC058579 TaxID=3346548 RepID=UPI00365C609E